ncbi:hypothetical protein PAXINDRAFT_102468 [Paxillus involutus ATCC 200175]|uniref:F-box domain-containing protein n=1 Tax=Paxillus involutus ATCC 200175 TaxID=664439 RepID=A0A0C9TLU8_PAXIN|nr:hypothetical protein PAXINDRAFT_102468 [Paxillus involutus ATCC 200175]
MVRDSNSAADFLSFTNENGFPSLVNLEVNCRSPIVALHIFRAIHSTQLRDITLHFHVVASPVKATMAGLGGLFTFMASRPAWEQSIRSISLSMGAHFMTANDVRRLLPFNHLHHLTLDNTGLVLDDHLLDDMAKSWPMLKELFITNACSPLPSNATLNGLVPFSRHCPKIATLQLQLDAREVPAFVNTTDASWDECREGERTAVLLCVEATESAILDPTSVASFLLNLFPGIALSIMGDYGESQQDLLWRKVADITKGAPEVPTH